VSPQLHRSFSHLSQLLQETQPSSPALIHQGNTTSSPSFIESILLQMKSDRPRLLLLFYSPQLKARRKIITSQKKGLCLQREESTRPKSANVPRATDRGVGAMSIVESAAVLVSCKKHRLSYRWSVASTDRSSSAGSVGFLLHDNLQEKRTEKKTPKIEANPNKHMTTTHRRSRRDRTVKRVRSLIRP
jgi:hypothetical protein